LQPNESNSMKVIREPSAERLRGELGAVAQGF